MNKLSVASGELEMLHTILVLPQQDQDSQESLQKHVSNIAWRNQQ